MDDFTQRCSELIHRIPREGLDAYLGLPDAVDVYRTIDLDPATRRAYESLEKDLIARVGDGAVTAANAMVLVLRLAQVASGYAPTVTTDGEQRGASAAVRPSPLPEKARLLLDVLEDLPLREPVVVFCRFHHDLDAVQAVCDIQGRSYGELSGRRRDGLTDHGTMADVDVLGAQIKSGGVGIDLTRARYGIYYTLGFELADYLQSRKRLHRPGQTRPVTYVHLLAENTVERAIYGALRNRQQVVDTVLQCLGGGTR
jgi:SNF2 family DNA or RNA helicase